MAPIKFEENIKEKLEQREIQPSQDAWNKLSSRLNKEEKNSPKKSYWWLGIAASFIGLLIISIVMIRNTSNTHEVSPILVEEETHKNIPEAKEEQQNMVKEVVVVPEDSQKIEDKLQPIIKQDSKITERKKVAAKENNEQLIQSKKSTAINIDESVDSLNKEKELLKTQKSITEIKVDQVVAQIQELKSSSKGVTDREIDSLLSEAQKDIATQHLYNKTTKTVDAELLLMDVESDLEQSFRDRVFEALKSGYKKAKTAVADRNN